MGKEQRKVAWEANERAFGQQAARIIDALAEQRDKAVAALAAAEAERDAAVERIAATEKLAHHFAAEIETLREAGEALYAWIVEDADDGIEWVAQALAAWRSAAGGTQKIVTIDDLPLHLKAGESVIAGVRVEDTLKPIEGGRR